MAKAKTDEYLNQAFAQLSKAAARRKIYSRKAAKEGRPDVAHLLRAMSASEEVQAKRLHNSLIGRVDTSDLYLATIFEKEVQDILEKYTELIDNVPAERPALKHALSQLRAAEIRLRAFYVPESYEVKADTDTRYFVCNFCGYVSTGSVPKKCPICTASKDAFKEVE